MTFEEIPDDISSLTKEHILVAIHFCPKREEITKISSS